MSQPHPADADYTALNAPNEDELMAMMDSAIVLHETLVRRGRRVNSGDFIRVQPDGTAFIRDLRPLVEVMRTDDAPWGHSPEPAATVDLPNFSQALFDEAVAKAEAERGQLSAVDSQMVRQFLLVLDEWMERLRSLHAAAENAVMGHALNSIDLGRIGLKKVEGGEDGG